MEASRSRAIWAPAEAEAQETYVTKMPGAGMAARTGYGLAALRVIVGLIFVAHGAQKLFGMGPAGVAGMFGHVGIPVPGLTSTLVIGVELLGGAALALGLGTRFAAAFIGIDMLGAIGFVHLKHGLFLPMGIEYPLTLLAVAVLFALSGPGALALDGLLARRGRR